VVAGTISMESGEGRGWSDHCRRREAEGGKGARMRWFEATTCKGKGKGARGTTTLAKAGPVVGRERKGRSGAGGAAWRRDRGTKSGAACDAPEGGPRPAACPGRDGAGWTCGPRSTVIGGGEYDSN
jgi:hypothetical protein